MKAMKWNDNRDEVAYARTRLKAAQEALVNATDAETRLKWDHACRGWTQIILTALDRNARNRAGQGTLLAAFLGALRKANDEQGWR